MAKVTFFLLEEVRKDAHPAELHAACQLASQNYRQKQRCLLLCKDQAEAEQLDELLWQLPVEAFVPHNLSGEGPANGTAVEICWEMPARPNKGVLINLTGNLADNHQRFSTIYDFVPAEESLKQQARERYKHYREAGHQLDTRPATTLYENIDG